MPERPATLPALLIELFSEAELRPFLRKLPRATDLVEALPGQTATYAHQVDEAVAALQRRGLVNSALFDALRRERPVRVADIDAVERSVLEPVEPTLPTVSGGVGPAFASTRSPQVDGKIQQVGVVLVGGVPNRTGFVAGPGGLVLTAGHKPEQLGAGPLSFKLESGSDTAYPARLDTNFYQSHGLDVAILVLDPTLWDSPVQPVPSTHHMCGAGYTTFAWTGQSAKPWTTAKGDINALIQQRLELDTCRQIGGMSGCPLMQQGYAVAVGNGRYDKALVGLAEATPLARLPADVLNRLSWVRPEPFRAESEPPVAAARSTTPVTGTNWVVARLEHAASQGGWLMRSLAFCRPSVRPARRWPGTGKVISKAEDLYAAMQHDRQFLADHPGSPGCEDLLLQLDVADTDALTEFERWFHERMEARIHALFRCVVIRPMGRNSRAAPDRFEPPPSAATLCRALPTPKPALRDACKGVALMVAGPQVPHKHALDLFEGLPTAILHDHIDQDAVVSALFPDKQGIPPLTLLDNVTALRMSSDHRVIVLWNEPDLASDEPLLQTA